MITQFLHISLLLVISSFSTTHLDAAIQRAGFVTKELMHVLPAACNGVMNPFNKANGLSSSYQKHTSLYSQAVHYNAYTSSFHNSPAPSIPCRSFATTRAVEQEAWEQHPKLDYSFYYIQAALYIKTIGTDDKLVRAKLSNRLMLYKDILTSVKTSPERVYPVLEKIFINDKLGGQSMGIFMEMARYNATLALCLSVGQYCDDLDLPEGTENTVHALKKVPSREWHLSVNDYYDDVGLKLVFLHEACLFIKIITRTMLSCDPQGSPNRDVVAYKKIGAVPDRKTIQANNSNSTNSTSVSHDSGDCMVTTAIMLDSLCGSDSDSGASSSD